MDEDSNGTDPSPDRSESVFSGVKSGRAVLSDNEGDLDVTENSEATVRRILSSYDIGNKLRHLRLRKKIGLVDLGRHTGLSASMLSQLENGKLVPTLATLARIAMVFDVGLDYFFTDRKRRRPFLIIRSSERMKFPDRPAATKPDYVFECLAYSAQEKSLQAYLAQFPERSAEEVTEHHHEGGEFVHVVSGTLVIRYQGEDYTLCDGDSVYFDASEPHSYRGASPEETKAVVVTTPPRL